MGLFDRFKRTSKESLLGYLQNSISDNSSLEHIVSMFEEMCNMPLKEDMILFETGTYSFTGKPMFNFSLVRQFPNDEEEYYQIHVDVLYIPTEENKDFQRTIWNEDIEEDELDDSLSESVAGSIFLKVAVNFLSGRPRIVK